MSSDPDQIRDDIERTQRELSTDVDELTKKVSPARIVERRVQRTRGALANLKERIMGSTSSGAASVADTASGVKESVSSTASSAVDTVTSAPDMARQRTEGNPLAAGLIAFGAGWLVSSLLPPSQVEQRAATQVKDKVSDKAQPVAEQLGQAAREMKEDLREPAQQAAESVKATATEAATTVKEETKSAAGDVADQAQQSKDTMTERTAT